jgi:hypothetical protein
MNTILLEKPTKILQLFLKQDWQASLFLSGLALKIRIGRTKQGQGWPQEKIRKK